MTDKEKKKKPDTEIQETQETTGEEKNSAYPYEYVMPASQKKVSILRQATTRDILAARRLARSMNHSVNIYAEEEFMPHLISVCCKFEGCENGKMFPDEIMKLPGMDTMMLESLVLGGVQSSSPTKS